MNDHRITPTTAPGPGFFNSKGFDFKDAGAENPFTSIGVQDCLKLERVVLRNFLSSRMKTDEFNFASTILWSLGCGDHVGSDGMGGTPLNEAIIIAPEMVKEFQRKNKLEIVNTIFLTDGESNGMSMNLENPTGQTGKNGVWKSKYFYTDKETGKTYELPWSMWGSGNTAAFLKVLKDRTGSNLIGFFLYGESWNRFVGRFKINQQSYDYMQKVTKFWRDNKFYPVKSEGYDDYYVIDSKALKNTENELAIDNTKSTKQMAKAFSKFASKKSVNRVLLRQFVERISGQSKKVA